MRRVDEQLVALWFALVTLVQQQSEWRHCISETKADGIIDKKKVAAPVDSRLANWLHDEMQVYSIK